MIQVLRVLNIRNLFVLSGLLLMAAGSGCGTNVNNDSTPIYPLEIVSVNGGGAPANDGVYRYNNETGLHVGSISSDGNSVVFSSRSTNLDPLDSNSQEDVYIQNKLTGKTELVSASSDNQGPGNQYSWVVDISDDGRYVLFRSRGNNFAAGVDDLNNGYDFYLRDTVNKKTVLVGVNRDISGGYKAIDFPGYEDFGAICVVNGVAWVAFVSNDGDDLVERNGISDSNIGDDILDMPSGPISIQYDQVFLRKIPLDNDGGLSAYSQHLTFLISLNQSDDALTTSIGDDEGGADSSEIDMAYNTDTGRLVICWASSANDFDQTNVHATMSGVNWPNDVQIFFRTFDPAHTFQNGTYYYAAMSPPVLVSRHVSDTHIGDEPSAFPSISQDGKHIVFLYRDHTLAGKNSEAVHIDFNGVSDVMIASIYDGGYATDLTEVETKLVSIGTGLPNGDETTGGVLGNAESVYPSVSSDGRYVTWQTTSYNLVSGDYNGYEDVFLRDMSATPPKTTLVSRNLFGGIIEGTSTNGMISANGEYVLFFAEGPNIFPTVIGFNAQAYRTKVN